MHTLIIPHRNKAIILELRGGDFQFIFEFCKIAGYEGKKTYDYL